MTERRTCLVFLPHSYTGHGPAESCVRILEASPGAGWRIDLYLLSSRTTIPLGIDVRPAIGWPLRHLPFRLVGGLARHRIERLFAIAIDRAPPDSIAWFWPDAPRALVRRARSRGLITVREMINSPRAHARPILDGAYAQAGAPAAHGLDDASVELENAELREYDYLFASNSEVEAALGALGIDTGRILSTSFGYSKGRLDATTAFADRSPGAFQACFLGTVNVRKGAPVLLEAWTRAAIDGRLVLAGPIEKALRPKLAPLASAAIGAEMPGPVSDIAALFAASDVFVLPTFEEGGPQVTYEAAAAGLPVITTPMGAARLVVDGESGLIVPAGDVDSLARALRRMADDRALRARCAAAIAAGASRFEYLRVGTERAAMLAALLADSAER